MERISPGLAAQKGLRGQILVELKRSQPLTAKDLAGRFGVSPNAVRRHLKELEVEGLVVHTRERRGQGAPTYAFRLSEAGEALFPKRYGEALNDVLSFVAEMSGRDEVHRIFAERFRAAAERLRVELEGAPVEDRVAAVADLLSREGFMAEWTVDDGRVLIAEHNCAMQAAAEQFPEICAAEAEFLRSVLGAELERKAYIFDGCNACEYAIDVATEEDAATNETTEER